MTASRPTAGMSSPAPGSLQDRPGPRPAGPRPVADTFLLTGRAVRTALRSPQVILAGTAFPALLLLVMVASFARVVNPGGTYADYVQFALPGFCVLSVLFATVTTGTAVHGDLRGGLDARLRAMPVTRLAPLAARIAGDALRGLLQVLLLLGLGALLGFRLSGGALAAAGFVLLPVVLASGVAWVAVLLGVRSGGAESVGAALTPWLLLAFFVSTALVPADALPVWLQGIARANPVSAVCDAMRALATGTQALRPVLLTLAWSAGLTTVFAPLAVRAWQRAGTRR